MGLGEANSMPKSGNGDVESADEIGGVNGGLNINIRCSNGSKFSVKTSLDSSVESFKSVIAQNCDIPSEQQRLIYKGRILKGDQTLQSYGLEADHTVHLVRGFSSTSAAAGNAANAEATNANPTVPRNAAPGEGGGFGGAGLEASLFPGLGVNRLGNGGNLFGAGLPNLEQMQQQLTQNPNMMRDMLNMPLVQSLMNNPEIIRNMITSNPQMREIMDRNPELSLILNDPAILHQSMEAARNPEMMREMMRSTDRAMSNIESSPEGFNMLRRMYENVQEPLQNATNMAGDNRSGSGLNPFAALFGTQGGAPGGGGQQTNQTTTASSTETAGNTPAPNANPLPNPWASTGMGGAPTNNTARVNPAGDARAPLPGGLGGLGFPGFEQMLGTMPDPSSINQLMQNPTMSQMMQSLLANPQYMNQILGSNSQLSSMVDSNPQLREMLQNPEIVRQLTSPEMMQQLATLQQSVHSQFGQQQSREGSDQNAGGAGAGSLDAGGLGMLLNMFGGGGNSGLAFPNRPNVPTEEQYATQLSQLEEMGFYDAQENLRALIATNGNVHAAVERLLGA